MIRKILLFLTSGSNLKRGGVLSEMLLSTYKTARCYNPEDCNLGYVLSRIVLQMAVLTMTAMKGSLAVPFITAFSVLLLFCCRSIFETVLFLSAAVSPFDRCEEAESEGESVCAVANSGSLSLQ
jgi:hypothetical protein